MAHHFRWTTQVCSVLRVEWQHWQQWGVRADSRAAPAHSSCLCHQAASALQPAQCHSTPGIPMTGWDFRKWRENATQFGTEKKSIFPIYFTDSEVHCAKSLIYIHLNQCNLVKALKFWDPSDLSTTSDQFFIFSLKYDQYKFNNAWLSNYVRFLDDTLDQE